MANPRKILIFVLFLFLLTISSCGKKDVEKAIEDIRTGTQGITVSFLPNFPPPTIYVEQDRDFDVVVELKNLGAYPQPEEEPLDLDVYLSGYDRNILSFNVEQNDLERLPISLLGKSMVNLNGGSDIVTFKGRVTDINRLNVERYEPTLQATACYKYITLATASVCIDPDPYSTIKEKKVCEVRDITMQSQGAPIAITRIDEEAFATKTKFKITIKNVGNGDVLKHEPPENLNKCNPFGTSKLGREDVDKVKLESVRIGDAFLVCQPFAEDSISGSSGFIRLINGEGSIICEFDKDADNSYRDSKTAYTTPLSIELSYGYRTTAERKLEIKKET